MFYFCHILRTKNMSGPKSCHDRDVSYHNKRCTEIRYRQRTRETLSIPRGNIQRGPHT